MVVLSKRRDSGMEQSLSTAEKTHASFNVDSEKTTGSKAWQAFIDAERPEVIEHASSASASALKRESPSGLRRSIAAQGEAQPSSATSFLGISTDIPTISFEDLTTPGSIQFSKRGSILIGGRRAREACEATSSSNIDNYARVQIGRVGLSRRVLSEDEEVHSLRVRSMYEDDLGRSALTNERKPSLEAYTKPKENDAHKDDANQQPQNNIETTQKSGENAINHSIRVSRGYQQLAGGVEDWENVDGRDVDRYGFINRKSTPNNVSSSSLPVSSTTNFHRVSTALQLASDAPRKQLSKLGRSTSVSKSTRSAGQAKSDNMSRLIRPLSSQSSYRSTSSVASTRLRMAANRLPYNRSRRILEEAGDMLTLPPGLADIAEHEDGGRAADMSRKKEWEREVKWRKMAKCENDGGGGGGMVFSFDTTNAKLIERTWKGIPDKWRATAWHAFLSASARKVSGSVSDRELIVCFHELIDQGSPDDVQIDIDVPRTINGHIMFRRRYSGGQRLLFRVLHCISLFFPDTGYVQGMAALAATLLCYFDEEMAFVMLVRMWQLRGLERLYKPGFGGLMEALQEFESEWLNDGPVGSKLAELGIAPTAYGTRWYLTVFNYSIPFPAQLRVWDVFLLLGDQTLVKRSSSALSFHGQLDVLHAVSTALIDATREILLDSDFENAMKVLTSWVPIRDEDLLMEVAKTEWKSYRRRK